KFPSKTSSTPLWKSVAKRYGPAGRAPPAGIIKSVRPLKTAPEAESSTARVAWVERAAPPPLTPAVQPEIVPSSVAKMNSEVPLFVPSLTTNDVLPGTSKRGLKTMPVGVEGPLEPAGGGMVTDGRTGLMFPASSKSAEVPAPLSLFQKSPGFLAATP